MSQWGIKFIGQGQFKESDWEYYTGESYVVIGEKYAVSSSKKEEAKPYSSEKRAKNAVTSMYGKFENVRDAKVVPL